MQLQLFILSLLLLLLLLLLSLLLSLQQLLEIAGNGDCTYEIGELIEAMENLGLPCNGTCNLPFPAQKYEKEGEFKFSDNLELPEMIRIFLNQGEFIHARAKLTSDEEEIACVEVTIDYSLE